MLYVPKIDDYLKILTDDEVKDFIAINFSEYFKSITKEPNRTKVDKLLYFSLKTPDKVEKHVQSNSSDNYIHHHNAEPMIKNKLKELLSKLKKFKVQTILF